GSKALLEVVLYMKVLIILMYHGIDMEIIRLFFMAPLKLLKDSLSVQFQRPVPLDVSPLEVNRPHVEVLNAERLRRAPKDVLVMHPGPINRGVELTSEVADGPNSCILQQVTNGLAIRMAVLYLVSQATE
ncbi:hypothetical protein LCGC14_2311220, partial [marine sediment metagenome]